MSKVRYNQGDGVIKIIIEDDSGKKVEVFKANQSDKKEHARIGRTLKDKFDIDLTPVEGFFDY